MEIKCNAAIHLVVQSAPLKERTNGVLCGFFGEKVSRTSFFDIVFWR
jgi:hypothetical protein